MFKKFSRITIVYLVFCLITTIFVGRLMQLQVFEYDKYTTMAKQQHWGGFKIPAKRGKIMIKDHYSGEEFALATNTVKEMLFMDPSLAVKEERVDDVVDFVAPLIFDEVMRQQIEQLKQNVELAEITSAIHIEEGEIVIEKIDPLSVSGHELLQNLMTKNKEAQMLDYKNSLKQDIIERAKSGNKYYPLLRDMPQEISEVIKEGLANPGSKKILRPLGIVSEYGRYYPEKEMLSTSLGFVNNEGYGQYGLEEQFDILLRGEDGMVIAEQDQRGRQLSIGENEIIDAIHGADIYLTIDRAIQQQVESVADKYRKSLDADFVHIIVMETDTGKLLGVTSSPSYDPNDYTQAYALEPLGDINLEWYKNNLESVHRKYPIIEKDGKYYKYINDLGPQTMINHFVDDLYEPGSIFKPLIMASGIDAGEVTPWTRCDICSGPYKVDDFIIKTWNHEYYANQTMQQVLERSDNVGMIFVQQHLGKGLTYKYIRNFGIGMPTDIEFETEKAGILHPYRTWSDAEAATLSFGQGLTLTPIQMISAINAIANNGNLMRPYIVEKIMQGDEVYEMKFPKVIRRVITSKTSDTMKAMMIGVIEKEAGKLVRIPGYYIGGKTGTAQIARGGGYEEGIGSTIASFVGFAPAEIPKFTILIKVDRPRTTQWGSEAAGPIFKEVAGFALQYYKVPKNRE